MIVTLDGAQIRSEADLHRMLSQSLEFGPYYGNNLAALWDRLTTDVARPIEVVWENVIASRKSLGVELFGKIQRLLLEVQASDEKLGYENRFTVNFKDT